MKRLVLGLLAVYLLIQLLPYLLAAVLMALVWLSPSNSVP